MTERLHLLCFQLLLGGGGRPQPQHQQLQTAGCWSSWWPEAAGGGDGAISLHLSAPCLWISCRPPAADRQRPGPGSVPAARHHVHPQRSEADSQKHYNTTACCCCLCVLRCVWAAVGARVVIRCRPLLRAAQQWLAAAAAVAADGGGATDVVLLQHPADGRRRTLCCQPLCLQRLPVRPQLLWTHMYPRLSQLNTTTHWNNTSTAAFLLKGQYVTLKKKFKLLILLFTVLMRCEHKLCSISE